MAATWYYLQLPNVASSEERVMTGKTRNERSEGCVRDLPLGTRRSTHSTRSNCVVIVR